MSPLRTLVAVLVTFAGIANGVGGILALFPGVFEAEMARTAARAEAGNADAGEAAAGGEATEGGPSLVALARTRYGATALLLLTTALVQIAVASQLPWLLVWPRALVPAAAVVLGIAAELWGWQLESELSVFNVFGLAASGLLAVVTATALRRGGAAAERPSQHWS